MAGNGVEVPKELQPRRFRTTDELVTFQGNVAALGRGIIANKNRDYGDTENNDPFANFRRHGALGILVRMDDKLSRLTSFAKKGKLHVEDEGVMDTVIDLLNYSAIFAAFLLDLEARGIDK